MGHVVGKEQSPRETVQAWTTIAVRQCTRKEKQFNTVLN